MGWRCPCQAGDARSRVPPVWPEGQSEPVSVWARALLHWTHFPPPSCLRGTGSTFLGTKIRTVVFNQREQNKNKSTAVLEPGLLWVLSARLAGGGQQGAQGRPRHPDCECTETAARRPRSQSTWALPAGVGPAAVPSWPCLRRVRLQHLRVALLCNHTVLPH